MLQEEREKVQFPDARAFLAYIHERYMVTFKRLDSPKVLRCAPLNAFSVLLRSSKTHASTIV